MNPPNAPAPSGIGAAGESSPKQTTATVAGRPAGRDSFAEVGVELRAMIDRAVAARLNGRQWRIVGAVVSAIASYSRIDDEVYAAHIAALSGVPPAVARAELRRLNRLGVLSWEGAQGRHRKSRLSLRKRDSDPIPFSRQEKGLRFDPLSGKKRDSDPTRKGTPIRPPLREGPTRRNLQGEKSAELPPSVAAAVTAAGRLSLDKGMLARLAAVADAHGPSVAREVIERAAAGKSPVGLLKYLIDGLPPPAPRCPECGVPLPPPLRLVEHMQNIHDREPAPLRLVG